MIELNKIIHADCMDIMKDIPDKYFELAIVDPPYGIMNKTKRGTQRSPHKYKIRAEKWDNKPDKKYFNDLKRISVNQIICGYNYFAEILGNCQAFIFWYKRQPIKNYSDGELIYTSFLDRQAVQIDYTYYGNINSDRQRFHPTQKPVALYRWLLQNYAKTGDKIIDTNSGSGSCAIACHLEKFYFLAIEKDKDYFDASVKRFNEIKQQYTFNFSDVIPEIESHQGILL